MWDTTTHVWSIMWLYVTGGSPIHRSLAHVLSCDKSPRFVVEMSNDEVISAAEEVEPHPR